MTAVLTPFKPGIFTSDFLGSGVRILIAGRNASAAGVNQEELAAAGVSVRDMLLPVQRHTDLVLAVGEHEITDLSTPADGLMTAECGPVLGVKTADCLSLFLWDPVSQSAGVVHAGWRGLKAGLPGKAIQFMAHKYGAAETDVRVYLGPRICRHCYEVGAEFKEYFPGHFIETENTTGKGQLDLGANAAGQLQDAGILKENIGDCGLCTSCDNPLFYSFRKERTELRNLSLVWISAPD